MRAVRKRSRLLQREVVVPTLVIGSLVVAVVAGIAAGLERPYPGFALGSGLLLVLGRAAVAWAFALGALVVSDQALRGRLPIEISGRGVRYAEQEQIVDVADVNDDVDSRLGELEAALAAIERRSAGS